MKHIKVQFPDLESVLPTKDCGRIWSYFFQAEDMLMSFTWATWEKFHNE
jgi:hypothetical protein